MGDIVSSIFGRRGGAKEPDVEEIETTVAIPFRVAALGGKVPITLTLSEVCPTCGGRGAAPGATIATCPECKGRGTISFGQGGFAVNRPCPVCRGKGTVPSQRCGTCQGSGEVRVEKRLNVTIPPGTEDGTRVRLKNQGAKGLRGPTSTHPGARRAYGMPTCPICFRRLSGVSKSSQNYAISSSNPGMFCRGAALIGVSIHPGASALTRTPEGPHSRAVVFVRLIMAAFEVP